MRSRAPLSNAKPAYFRWDLTIAGAVLLISGTASAQVKLYLRYGDHGFDELGTDVAAAGDVNADGVPDFIAGAPRNATGNGVGYARVYSGIDGSALYTFTGVGNSDQFGGKVAAAGDVNHDGYADVIVDSLYSNVNDVTGRAQVFSGLDGSVLYTFFGEVSLFFSADPVAGVGDLDGDGHDDVLVGEPFCSAAGPNAGRVRVYSGATGAILRECLGTSAQQLGWSAAAAGDVNLDGIPDFIVGGRASFSASIGHAWVFSGANGSLLYTFSGSTTSDGFADAVSGAGDVNNDGFDDLIVGARYDSTVANSAGMARVYSGANGSVLYTIYGTQFGPHYFGTDVAAAGDRDGDGYDDFMISTPDTSVASGTGFANIYSGFDGHLLYQLTSHNPNDAFGTSIAKIGDVNGDGAIDYVVGGYTGSQLNQSDIGLVYVLSLAPTYANYCTSTPNSTGAAALLRGSGYGTVSNNDLVLTATQLPHNQSGIMIASHSQGTGTLGNGNLCLAPKIWRINTAFNSGATGTIVAPVNHNLAPWNSLLVPGSTWNFQIWYRDAAAGGAGCNSTDGVQATFVP